MFRSGTALDGVYRFKMQKLKRRWDEILALPAENAAYIADENTFFELIRFLFSNIDARVKDVSLKGLADGKLIFSSCDEKEIVYALIDYAPITVSINKSFNNDKTVKLITQIFGG